MRFPKIFICIDYLRMTAWLFAGLAFYFLAIFVPDSYPALQTVLYKMGHVTTLAWVGYWISRQALGRVLICDTPPVDRLARAVLMAGVILAGSMGL